jgi:hypothetical protein
MAFIIDVTLRFTSRLKQIHFTDGILELLVPIFFCAKAS